MIHPTKLQLRILEYLKKQIRSDGFPPSFREIGKRFGIQSVGSVKWHLKKLEGRGLLILHTATARGITITKKGR